MLSANFIPKRTVADTSVEEFYELTQLMESSLLASCTWNDSAARMEQLMAPVSHSPAAEERILRVIDCGRFLDPISTDELDDVQQSR